MADSANVHSVDKATAGLIDGVGLQDVLTLSAGCSKSTTPVADIDCSTCLEIIPANRIWRALCQHYQSLGCLQDWFGRAIHDPTLYSPKCCDVALAWEEIRENLQYFFVIRFEAKKELDDPNPLFCHGPICRAYISARLVKDQGGNCDTCSWTTCTVYTGAGHVGECPGDLEMVDTFHEFLTNWKTSICELNLHQHVYPSTTE